MIARKKRASPQYLVYKGVQLTIEFYYNSNGRMPGFQYYKRCPEAGKRRFLHIVEHLAGQARGEPLPKTMFNMEDHKNRIFAVKPASDRYLGFYAPGGKFIITNAYTKQTQKLGRREQSSIEAAIKMKTDYADRVRKEEYYEEDKD